MEDGGLEEQLSSDLQQVNSLNQDQLEGLVNLVLNFLMNPATSEFQSGLGAFAEEHRYNFILSSFKTMHSSDFRTQ